MFARLTSRRRFVDLSEQEVLALAVAAGWEGERLAPRRSDTPFGPRNDQCGPPRQPRRLEGRVKFDRLGNPAARAC